ncbi:MAG: hypothetical protein JGK17_00130 [Microcoleus sp. PH2017_10_PVI_O_A]|uniref:hypothetical protein n=1 Tax=unclassified Microcoleus TaxID=2642155 RepID=UPI001DFCAA10|nr:MULTISPECIES: hypothetical protein [unclassified Microcoleus]TAE85971.1 MAG: hypothetical protein EAZ83_01110 [Oscillatoriales cyanobacterium]MCC3404029.1 hypothetical protein [Microcoleus sp. PH2017_10_PVI_O_A]MCC3458112.1 hypothetical protein [Microcoleus sp. PH2017_11_PCY_U_A]MCC3476534.1 hypothetical protein [Microcoleus sp. PH2017_12_PCY_D_A]MCC3527125.1 hypothetical protein [Microcoleus sp. PH2017_21_RUC_O_A]
MNNSDAATPLKSHRVSRLLMQFAWANVSLNIVSLLLTSLTAIAPTMEAPLQGLQQILLIVTIPVALILIVLLLVWLYRLHVDLKVLFNDYPITPGGAVARFIIPIYSIWGIWNTLSTFANRFNQEGGESAKCAEYINPLNGGLYALTITSNILNREYSRIQRESPEIEPLWLFLLNDLVALGLSCLLLLMVKSMSSAVVAKARQPK